MRQATAEQHRRLDRGLEYVLSERLSIGRYIDLLGALFGFYTPLEHVLQRWETGRLPLGLPLVSRAGLLRQDLRVFGRVPEHVPTCTRIPTFTTTDHVAGAIYVVEGASLGGQVIARQLQQHHGIGRGNGAAFFNSDGSDVAVRWKHVVAWLDERGYGAAAGDEIAAGARCTFAALTQWLSDRGVLDE